MERTAKLADNQKEKGCTVREGGKVAFIFFTRGNARRSVEQSREPQRAVTVLAPLSLFSFLSTRP